MFIELSYPIGPHSTVLDPGLKPPTVIPRSRFEDGKRNNTSYLELFAHTGTHLDMPWHFNPRGNKILDFEIGDFVFQSVVLVDIPKGPWEPVTETELRAFEDKIAHCDALLIRTGNNELRRTNPDVYIRGIPGLSVEAAQYLASFDQLRLIGMDFMSVENIEKARPLNYPVHHALLDRPRPMLLLEDANLTPAGQHTIQRLYLFPLRVEDLEASPVTAVAEVEY
ncbi:MAG: hypothetical protein GYA17_07455 [Chloroflexi bacterium]|nr:cyclase family protein [Anaerolineaceae bacterium]NMB88180.1 hypothetical protein [Chloroflexota bacterium]